MDGAKILCTNFLASAQYFEVEHAALPVDIDKNFWGDFNSPCYRTRAKGYVERIGPLVVGDFHTCSISHSQFPYPMGCDYNYLASLSYDYDLKVSRIEAFKPLLSRWVPRPSHVWRTDYFPH